MYILLFTYFTYTTRETPRRTLLVCKPESSMFRTLIMEMNLRAQVWSHCWAGKAYSFYRINNCLVYRIRRNFHGMKFLLNKTLIGFSWLYFCGSQVHCRKVARAMCCYKSNFCKLSNFYRLNFRCIRKWPWNPRNLHTAETSVRTVTFSLHHISIWNVIAS